MKKFLFIILLLPVVAFSQIARDAIVRDIDTDGGATFTTSTITGGSDKTFVFALVIRGDDDISSGPTGGSLTWTEEVDACADGGQQGIHIWTAQGTASSFTVSVTLAGNSAAVIGHLVTYSGVETTSGFEDQHWEDANAEGTANPGGCAAIDGSSPATFTIGNSAADSWFFIAVAPRNKTVDSGDSGLSNKIVDTGGTGGDLQNLTTYDLDRSTSTGDVAYSFTLSGNSDWVVGGIVMKELSGGAERRIILIN